MEQQVELSVCVVDLGSGRISGEREGKLAHRELQLLRYLVEHEGEPVSRDALMKMFGYAPTAQSRAVDKAMHALRSKVEATPSAPDHLRTVAGGYVLVRAAPVAPASGPRERDAFVGREADLERLARSLGDGPLVCVTGPAGVGKTRLAVRYCAGHPHDWPGGIWFCDLSEARTRSGLAFGVALALSVPLGQGDEVQQLGHALAARGRCLLVLDNLEQVVEPAREVLSAGSTGAPALTVLATSRAVLGVAGERVLELDVLPISDASTLFLLRAEAVLEGYRAEHGQDEAIAALVRQLDGLPLAIELAAARSRVLGPQELLARLSDRFRLLARSGPAGRHATLRAAMDWSWNLLEPSAAAALAQLSVFEGGFDLEAVEAVVDLTAFSDAPWAPDALQSLVDRSLVNRLGSRRFGLLVSVQQYASEKLDPIAHARASERHGQHFAGFGTDDALRALGRHGGARRRASLVGDVGNLVVASERAVARETRRWLHPPRSPPGRCYGRTDRTVPAWHCCRRRSPFHSRIGNASGC